MIHAPSKLAMSHFIHHAASDTPPIDFNFQWCSSESQDGRQLSELLPCTSYPHNHCRVCSIVCIQHIGGASLQMPPWTGAGLPRRRIHACVGDCVATESSVGFDGQSCRASFSAEDTRRLCIPCGSGSSMEHPTVTSHHLHRWRHSNATSRLSCSWDRTFKPDIG